jgi:hypothetical protein
VTQDVFEHVFDIDAALREIARTLKPGGAHLFTTPLVRKAYSSEPRARRRPDGSIDHLAPPEYHRNPMDPNGSLVTWHFGFDLAERILRVAGMPTLIVEMDRIDWGIRAKFIEVLASFKPGARSADSPRAGRRTFDEMPADPSSEPSKPRTEDVASLATDSVWSLMDLRR